MSETVLMRRVKIRRSVIPHPTIFPWKGDVSLWDWTLHHLEENGLNGKVPPGGGRAVWCTSRVVVLRSYIKEGGL
jgi:hypothetical protein